MKKGISARQFMAGIIAFFVLIAVCPALSSSPSSSPNSVVSSTRTPRPTIAPTKTLRAPTRTPKSLSFQACVKDTSVRVRQGPGTQYPAINGLASGTCMTVLGRNQDSSWVYMRAGAKTGWVAAWLLEIDASLSQAPLQTVANPLPSSTVAPPQVAQNKKTPNAQNQNAGNQSGANSSGNNSAGNDSSGGNPSVSGGDSSGPAALCNDGTYSYSSRRRGTCSHHGGVAEWLQNLPP